MQEEAIMSEQFEERSRHLSAREVLDIRDGQGIRVKCVSGALWITQSNDSNDIIVGRGESFVLDRPGLALINALIGPADVVIQPAAGRPVEPRRVL
jgi:hypothetical protein